MGKSRLRWRRSKSGYMYLKWGLEVISTVALLVAWNLQAKHVEARPEVFGLREESAGPLAAMSSRCRLLNSDPE